MYACGDGDGDGNGDSRRRIGAAREWEAQCVFSDRRQRRAAHGKDTVTVPAGSGPKYKWCVGARLMGANNCHRDVINGGLYEVIGLSPCVSATRGPTLSFL